MVRTNINDSLKKDASGQMHTLEAVTATMIMVSVIVFTVQATSLTPLTSSTANAHIEAQMQTMGQDMLNILGNAPSGSISPLRQDILSWNGEEFSWNGTAYCPIISKGSTLLNSSTAEILKEIAVPRGIAHNVLFTYIDSSGLPQGTAYIYNGDPSDNAVSISRKVLLSDHDISDTVAFLANTGIPDSDPSSDFYNIVDVRLTLWRM
jgi:hypothetical protein